MTEEQNKEIQELSSFIITLQTLASSKLETVYEDRAKQARLIIANTTHDIPRHIYLKNNTIPTIADKLNTACAPIYNKLIADCKAHILELLNK